MVILTFPAFPKHYIKIVERQTFFNKKKPKLSKKEEKKERKKIKTIW